MQEREQSVGPREIGFLVLSHSGLTSSQVRGTGCETAELGARGCSCLPSCAARLRNAPFPSLPCSWEDCVYGLN